MVGYTREREQLILKVVDTEKTERALTELETQKTLGILEHNGHDDSNADREYGRLMEHAAFSYLFARFGVDIGWNSSSTVRAKLMAHWKRNSRKACLGLLENESWKHVRNSYFSLKEHWPRETCDFLTCVDFISRSDNSYRELRALVKTEKSKGLYTDAELGWACELIGLESHEASERLILMQYFHTWARSRIKDEDLRGALKFLAQHKESKLLRNVLTDPEEVVLRDGRLIDLEENMPLGLYNIANTCYLNSIFQFYISIKPLREAVLRYQPAREPKKPKTVRQPFAPSDGGVEGCEGLASPDHTGPGDSALRRLHIYRENTISPDDDFDRINGKVPSVQNSPLDGLSGNETVQSNPVSVPGSVVPEQAPAWSTNINTGGDPIELADAKIENHSVFAAPSYHGLNSALLVDRLLPVEPLPEEVVMEPAQPLKDSGGINASQDIQTSGRTTSFPIFTFGFTHDHHFSILPSDGVDAISNSSPDQNSGRSGAEAAFLGPEDSASQRALSDRIDLPNANGACSSHDSASPAETVPRHLESNSSATAGWSVEAIVIPVELVSGATQEEDTEAAMDFNGFPEIGVEQYVDGCGMVEHTIGHTGYGSRPTTELNCVPQAGEVNADVVPKATVSAASPANTTLIGKNVTSVCEHVADVAFRVNRPDEAVSGAAAAAEIESSVAAYDYNLSIGVVAEEKKTFGSNGKIDGLGHSAGSEDVVTEENVSHGERFSEHNQPIVPVEVEGGHELAAGHEDTPHTVGTMQVVVEEIAVKDPAAGSGGNGQLGQKANATLSDEKEEVVSEGRVQPRNGDEPVHGVIARDHSQLGDVTRPIAVFGDTPRTGKVDDLPSSEKKTVLSEKPVKKPSDPKIEHRARRFTTLLRDLFGALIWSDDLNVEPQKELCQIALERPQGEALGEHQDPNECIELVMDLLDETLCRDRIKGDKSLLERIFFGTNRTTFKYLTRGQVTETRTSDEPFHHLIVRASEATDIYEALDTLYGSETPEGSNIVKEDTMFEPPTVLMLQLSRVKYDWVKHRQYKAQNHVSFHDTIYLDRYLTKNFEEVSRRKARWTEIRQRWSGADQFLQRWLNPVDGPSKPDGCLCFAYHYLAKEQQVQLRDAIGEINEEIHMALNASQQTMQSCKQQQQNLYTDMAEHPYRLYSVLMHKGEAHQGHFWSYMHDFEIDRWLCFNDADVKVVDQSHVFADRSGLQESAAVLVYVQEGKERELCQPWLRRHHERETWNQKFPELTISEEARWKGLGGWKMEGKEEELEVRDYFVRMRDRYLQDSEGESEDEESLEGSDGSNEW